MKIIARRGTQYLVQVNDETGRVLDVRRNVLFPAFPLASILARGDWEEYEDQALLDKLRPQVTRLDTQEDYNRWVEAQVARLRAE